MKPDSPADSQPAPPHVASAAVRTWSRRRFISGLSRLGGICALGVLTACGNQAEVARPATRGAPTLIPTVLPTAAPAGAARATPSATPMLGAGMATPTAETRAPTPRPSGPVRRDLVIMQGADMTTLDPHLSTFATDVSVTFSLFDNLMYRTEDQSIIRPMLATEWKVRERRWELRLRPNVRFHDGSPLTSADVKFSIERTYDTRAGTAVSNVFSTVERIETPDPLGVVFVTRQPDALLPARLASYGGQIVPKAYFERVGAAEFARRPVGSGPYRFVEWLKDDRLLLERFNEYWGGRAAVERVIFMPRPEVAPRIAALLVGEADLVTGVPADQIDVVNRSGRAHIDGALYNGIHVLAVNSTVPPLDNPLVKQALSLAIDRETIIKTVHRGQGVVPNGLIAQGDYGFDATLPPLEYNPDRARQRLQAGEYRGEPIVLETTQGYLVGDREMAELVDEMWRKVGINSHIEFIEIADRAVKTREKSFKGLFWSDPASTLLDPDGMMFRLLGPGGQQEYWSNPEWQQLGLEARYSLDQGLRLRSYRRMNEIALEHLPWIPIVQPRRLYGISNDIEFQPYGNDYLNLRRENLKLRT
ncbi:MAG: ABC transporter substrate-binding protein [Chloroflexota bacterium]